MTTSPADSSLAMAAVSQQDLVQRKQNIDSLRDRLGDNKSKEQELRESCEGFESIFLQKMWEQMRKNVPKEGYLHSKDEEMYQSLFDVELSKKMTSAGGIGLADMLYEQLSQQLVNTGRTTSPSTYRPPVIPPTTSDVLAANKADEKVAQKAPALLTIENLYTPLEKEVVTEPLVEEAAPDNIALALAEFAKIVKETPESTKVEPGRVADKDVALVAASTVPPIPASAEKKGNEPVTGEKIQAASWHSTARISATPRPVSKFSRKVTASAEPATAPLLTELQGKTQPQAHTMPAGIVPTAMSSVPVHPSDNESTAVSLAGMGSGGVEKGEIITAMKEDEGGNILPDRAFWPLEGKVRTPFGWYEGADNHQDWNPGVFIDAAEGSRVAACMTGEIVYSGEAEGFDNMVIVDHGDDYRSYYGNVSMHGLNTGDRVQGGMLFASVATSDQKNADSAKSSAFYFGLKRGDMALNPELAIPRFLTAQR